MRSGNALQGKRELYYLTTYKFGLNNLGVHSGSSLECPQ